jgi:hypothetical protein
MTIGIEYSLIAHPRSENRYEKKRILSPPSERVPPPNASNRDRLWIALSNSPNGEERKNENDQTPYGKHKQLYE